MITDFQAGMSVGALLGLGLSYFLFFLNNLMEERFKKREEKILENVKAYLNKKGKGGKP
jgi:predicted RND superfamily exporter protein